MNCSLKLTKTPAMHSAVSSIQLSFNFFFFLFFKKNLALSNKIEINDLIMKMNIFLFLKIDNFHIKLIPFVDAVHTSSCFHSVQNSRE